MENNIIEDYQSGYNIEELAYKYHFGKIKIKEILSRHNIEIRKRGGQKLKIEYKISDWKIEKYPVEDGYHYVAIFKEDGKEIHDYQNKGGFLTSYIREKIGIEIPNLHERRKYYMQTGDYWWEQWFDIEKRENKPTKKCPYCDWTTTDVNNNSGAFEVHLREKHNTSKLDYLKEFPQDREYFTLVVKTNDLQMSTDKDEYVECAICGKKLSRIDWRHLKEHNISQLEYIKKYNTNTVCKKLHDRLSDNAVLTNINLKPVRHSKPELEIKDFLIQNGVECRTDRKILNGKELDIFIQDKNIAIEFNGNKHHTEWFGNKSNHYHLNKTNGCKNKGVKLIHIFEDEFHNTNEIMFNKIAHILNIQQNLPKIYGRKSTISSISRSVAETFLNKYHIEGHIASTVYYGAFCGTELIAVMSFLKVNKQSDKWRLTRFASDYNYVCCGVCGKLFKHFIREHHPHLIESFADRRWTIDEENNVYIQLGFKFVKYTKPDYKYYNPSVDKYKRFNKISFNKSSLLRNHTNILTPDMSKDEMMQKLGYDKIWDCGLIKYMWSNE